ncbi:hypothetical protein [Kocuria sabuli]|uniref:hypothetical protein n=1 Tax=Kocuria sabuli TaxID=3071448 RepID=UPI0034D61E66
MAWAGAARRRISGEGNALWLGMGGGIAARILGDDRGSGVPLGTAVIAAAVLTAPWFACSVWLAARGR